MKTIKTGCSYTQYHLKFDARLSGQANEFFDKLGNKNVLKRVSHD